MKILTVFKRFFSTGVTKVNANGLSDELKRLIDVGGPLTIARYMKEALTHPKYGYYMNSDVFGAKGDFITSPDLSQLFGEMIAVWFFNEYYKLGSPKPVQFVELGPGRGTLSSDILRVFQRFHMSKSLDLHLVEASPFLSELQAKKLCRDKFQREDGHEYYQRGETTFGNAVYWYSNVTDVPKDKFSLIFANEFFDALPIHKLQTTERGWREVLVSNTNHFELTLAPSHTLISKLYEKLLVNETRNHVEVSPESEVVIRHVANRLEQNGGIALFADYGHRGDKEDTWRGFKRHKLVDPLSEDPGTIDLTADVDFKRLLDVATSKSEVVGFGPVEQSVFLKRMGIEVRLEMMLKKVNVAEGRILKENFDILVGDMGERFKFISLFPFVVRKHLEKFPVAGFS